MNGPETLSPTKKRTLAFIAIGSVALHLLKIRYLFHDVDFSRPFPLVNCDYILYYARAIRFHLFLQHAHRFWGYDPFQMAGYPAGPVHELNSNFFSLISHLAASLVPIWKSLLIMEMAVYLVAPFCVWFAVRAWRKEDAPAALAAVLFMYGTYDLFGFTCIPRGLLGYQAAVFLSFWQVSAFNGWCERPTAARWLLSTALAALIFHLTPLSIVVVGVPVAAIYVHAFNEFSPRDHLCVLGSILFVALANLYWLLPYFAFSNWHSNFPYLSSEGWRGLAFLLNPARKNIFESYRAALHLLILALAGASVVRRWRTHRGETFVVALWLAELFVAGYFGSDLPFLRETQPSRFIFPFWLLLSILAAQTLASLSKTSGRVLVPSLLIVGMGVVLPFASVAGVMARDVAWPRVTNRLPDVQTDFINYLKEEGPVDGRILIDCHENGTPHVIDMIPLWTGLAVLGGPNPGALLASRFTVFSVTWIHNNQPFVFNRPLEQFSEDDFFSYLELYNVTRIAVASRVAGRILVKFKKTLVPGEIRGGHQFFNVKRPSSWLVEGKGDVTFDNDLVRIKNPSAGRLVLKFHWIKTLRTEPALELSPLTLKDDPVPFISIINTSAAKEIVVRNTDL